MLGGAGGCLYVGTEVRVRVGYGTYGALWNCSVDFPAARSLSIYLTTATAVISSSKISQREFPSLEVSTRV